MTEKYFFNMIFSWTQINVKELSKKTVKKWIFLFSVLYDNT